MNTNNSKIYSTEKYYNKIRGTALFQNIEI